MSMTIDAASTAAPDRPNGPAAAAILAAGIGGLALGLVTTLAAMSAGFSTFLAWSAAVGPLSGKVGTAIAIWLVAWVALGLAWRDREVRFAPIFTGTLVLLGVGLSADVPGGVRRPSG